MDFRKPLKNLLREKYPTVGVADRLVTVIKTMARENASALLVQQHEDMVGIITISDILHSLAKGDDPHEIKVSTFMTSCRLITDQTQKTPCVQLDEDEDILSAIKVMNEAGINHILISGSKGEPVGMMSSLEIIKFLIS